MSKTATRGKPVPSGAQVAPPSVELYTPISVPANKLLELLGSIANAFTGTSGIPVPPDPEALVHVGGAPFKFVVFQTCIVVPKPESVMYAVFELFGSTTARAM